MSLVVYAATRNLYRPMAVALRSLLCHTRAEVRLLIEDDAFPEQLPENVRTINVSRQPYFAPDGPNYATQWSYMTLMRCALPKLFPLERRALWLDVDTIVEADITPLLETGMDGYCVAGVREPHKCFGSYTYINAGVLLCNLELLRMTGRDDEMIRMINSEKMDFPDQDAINKLCQGFICTVGGEWNASNYTERGHSRKIIHYAARKDWQNEPEYRKYL